MLSLVLPTYNEAENLPQLLPKIETALEGIPHEIIVVDDDSPDGTWRKAQDLAKNFSSLRVIRRQEERGLSSAVVAGFRAARGEVLAAMDADGQHDSSLIAKLYAAVRERKGIAIASRYIAGGGTGQWNERRRLISRIGTKLVGFLFRFSAKDPLSGFFAVDRALFARISAGLKPKGFKILFDLLVRVPRGTSVVEIPYTFAPRLEGKSKLSLRVHGAFILSLFTGFAYRYRRVQWYAFSALLLLALLLLLSRVWQLRLLSDSAIRSRTREAYAFLSSHEGWLISDLSLERVDPGSLKLLYRHHGRKAEQPRCLIVHLNYFSWSPCDDS